MKLPKPYEEIALFVSNMPQQISGFGGEYEETCRRMLINGLRWLNSHQDEPDPQYHTYENVYGICVDDNNSAKELNEAITAGEEDVTGAMHQAVVSHLFGICRQYEEWYKHMSKPQDDGYVI